MIIWHKQATNKRAGRNECNESKSIRRSYEHNRSVYRDGVRRYRRILEEARHDMDMSTGEWKTQAFLVEQMWDIDDMYYDGYFKANGWQDDYIRLMPERRGLLGYFDPRPLTLCSNKKHTNWLNPNTGMVAVNGITINQDFPFETLNDLRETIAHEMCHAYTHMQYMSLDEDLEDTLRENGHGKLWRANALRISQKVKHLGVDSFIIARYANDIVAQDKAKEEMDMAMKFCYYYIDTNDDYSNIRVFRVKEPIIAFEDMWEMMHYQRDSRVQTKLMLVKASDAFIASLCPHSYENLFEAFSLKMRNGRVSSSIDQFVDLPKSASRVFMKLVEDSKKRDMSYIVNGERVYPCEVMDEWTLEELQNM